MFSSMLSLLGSLRRGNFVQRSLRFRSSASAYLNRTPSVAGNRNTWTWSAWIKRGTLGTNQSIFVGYPSSVVYAYLQFNTSDQIRYSSTGSGANLITSSVYRDPSAWYHVVFAYDDTQPTASNRLKLYVNGQQITAFGTSSYPTQNFGDYINSAVVHNINRFPDGSSYFDGYLTEVNFIDGQALTPSSFGQIESTTGVWSPKQYAGSYGTNGFYLKFGNTSSVAALGTDSSGNGNTWTVNNVSLTAGATYDSMIDVPVNYSDGGNGRGNYSILSPVSMAGSTATLTNGNLSFANSSSHARRASSISVSSGKWYAEATITTVGGSFPLIGIASASLFNGGTYVGADSTSYGYASNATKYNNAAPVSYGASYTTNDIIGIALDLDAGTLTFYKNNISQGTAYSGLSGEFTFAASGLSGTVWELNFGQRPFTFTPPTGFRALNTNNLPTPSIVNGANFMAATTYTGNAAARSLSNAVNNVSFQPDLVWIKSRTPGATSHALFDSVRGAQKYLSSDTTAAETTNANTLTAFGADGFSLGTDATLVNASANLYVAWQWRESVTAGLDVVTYAGTGVNRTVAHNLGVAPAMVIVKRSQTGATSNWQVRHTSIAAANSIQLNSPNQAAAAATVWNSTAPTSSVFSLGTSTDVNASGISYVAYCFAEIAGFSRFGSYTGNGLPDGPFVFCGFRPRFVMIKRTDTNGFDWRIFDVARNSSNVTTNALFPNSALTEETTFNFIDILSNGLKPRSADNATNASGGTYIFAAFAEVPSKYALAR